MVARDQLPVRHRGGKASKLIAAQRLERLDVREEVGDLLEVLTLAAAVVSHGRTNSICVVRGAHARLLRRALCPAVLAPVLDEAAHGA